MPDCSADFRCGDGLVEADISLGFVEFLEFISERFAVQKEIDKVEIKVFLILHRISLISRGGVENLYKQFLA